MNKKIWFTSDTHFCHDKEFVWKARGYESVEKMNLDIMDRWNTTVNNHDDIYHLGDVMLKDNEKGMEILSQLKGHIHIILGNHDSDRRIALYMSLPNVVEVVFATRMKINKHRTFFLSHYPSLVANLDDNKSVWNLSGHTHTTDKFALKQNQIYNVGVDAHNCRPVHIDQILEDIRGLKE